MMCWINSVSNIYAFFLASLQAQKITQNSYQVYMNCSLILHLAFFYNIIYNKFMLTYVCFTLVWLIRHFVKLPKPLTSHIPGFSNIEHLKLTIKLSLASCHFRRHPCMVVGSLLWPWDLVKGSFLSCINCQSKSVLVILVLNIKNKFVCINYFLVLTEIIHSMRKLWHGSCFKQYVIKVSN